MTLAGGSVAGKCRECKQTLLLPVDDLGRNFRCPHCNAKQSGFDLLDTEALATAIPAAIPASGQIAPDTERTAPPPPVDQLVTAPMPAIERKAPPPLPKVADRTKPLDVAAMRAIAPPLPAPAPVRALPPPLPNAPQAIPIARAPVPREDALQLLARVDRFFSRYSMRRYVIVLSVVAVLATFFEYPLLGDFLSALFLIAVGLIGVFWILGRLDNSRDAKGFRAALVWESVKHSLEPIGELFRRVLEAKPGQLAKDVGQLFVVAGVAGGALSNLLALAGEVGAAFGSNTLSGAAATLVVLSFFAFAIGLGLILIGWARLRRDGIAKQLVVPNAQAGAVIHEAVRHLPVVIDCAEPGAASWAARCPPLLAVVLGELATWRPRARIDDEREYHDKFHLLLTRKAPAIPIAYEERKKDEYERGRVDLILGGKEHGLLVEMKAHIKGTELDRLVGQTQKYMRLFGQRTIVLVLCRTHPRYVPSVERAITGLRVIGVPVVAVLAAPLPLS